MRLKSSRLREELRHVSFECIRQESGGLRTEKDDAGGNKEHKEVMVAQKRYQPYEQSAHIDRHKHWVCGRLTLHPSGEP